MEHASLEEPSLDDRPNHDILNVMGTHLLHGIKNRKYAVGIDCAHGVNEDAVWVMLNQDAVSSLI
jgi:hypothetical protein